MGLVKLQIKHVETELLVLVSVNLIPAIRYRNWKDVESATELGDWNWNAEGVYVKSVSNL